MKKFRDFVNDMTRKRKLPRNMDVGLEKFLDEHVKGEWTYDTKRNEIDIIGYFVCSDWDIDMILVDGKMPFKFGTVKAPSDAKGGTLTKNGNFGIALSKKLTSLEGLPREIEGQLRLSHLSGVKRMEGCDNAGNMYLHELDGLETLEGSPVVATHIEIKYCQSLKNLEGIRAGEHLENFAVSGCKNLESLKGSPEKVSGHVSIAYCPNIKDYTDMPLGTIYSFLPQPNEQWSTWTYSKEGKLHARETIIEQEFNMDIIELWLKSGMTLKEFKEKKKTLIVSTKYGF